jgi:hypothetical protein
MTRKHYDRVPLLTGGRRPHVCCNGINYFAPKEEVADLLRFFGLMPRWMMVVYRVEPTQITVSVDCRNEKKRRVWLSESASTH